MNARVFVYGSLRRGFGNHTLLEGSQFDGMAMTDPNFTMIHLGGFPGIVAMGQTPITGEIYTVDLETLTRLDRLEGHPNFYKRTPVSVVDEGGDRVEVEAYLLDSEWLDGNHRAVSSGDWTKRA